MRSITYRSGCDAGRQLGEGSSGSRRDGGTVSREGGHIEVDVSVTVTVKLPVPGTVMSFETAEGGGRGRGRGRGGRWQARSGKGWKKK